MEPPFHKGKMANAAAKLRNNKSCGKDGLYAELLKHVPEEAQKQIENKLNHMRLTGECPIEIKSVMLTPLAKLPQKDVNINVRPIVCNYKNTIILINRRWNWRKEATPKSLKNLSQKFSKEWEFSLCQSGRAYFQVLQLAKDLFWFYNNNLFIIPKISFMHW